MSLAYRGLEYAAERRFTAAAAVRPTAPAILAFERRVARVVAGSVATLGGLALFAIALLVFARYPGLGDLLSDEKIEGPSTFVRPPWNPTLILIGAGLSSLVAYYFARLAARLHVRRVFARGITRSGDAAADLSRLETDGPWPVLKRRVSRLEYASVLMPMLGVSLLAPLTLHLPVGVAMGDFSNFGGWICTSAAIVGHAHLTLCVCCFFYARRLHRGAEADLLTRRSRDWVIALGFTVLTASVPGIILLGAPPAITAVTGLVFIPLLFNTMRARVIEERAAVRALAES